MSDQTLVLAHLLAFLIGLGVGSVIYLLFTR